MADEEQPKEEEAPALSKVLACDIARYGADYTAYARMDGTVLSGLWRRQGKSLMETAGELKHHYDAEKGNLTLIVDDTGLGGGVTDRLRELNVPVIAINFGSRPDTEDEYADKGSEIWALMARDLEHRAITFAANLPLKEELHAQLLQPIYTFTSGGKLKVQKLGVDGKDPSPDLGDALALADEGRRQGTAEFASGHIDPVGVGTRGQRLRSSGQLSHQRQGMWNSGSGGLYDR